MIARLILAIVLAVALPAAAAEQTLHIICYHDVRDELRESLVSDPEPTAISVAALVRQLTWLQDNGYRVVSLDEVIAARTGGKPLPDKAVLLTFDDGLQSLYTRVFPLLRLFGYPAVAAIVTQWVGTPGYATWEELAEMQRSGLVEIASHSAGLHRAIPANAFGTQTAAATTRLFDPARGARESEAEYRARIEGDIAESRRVISARLGRAPRAIAWPYGAYNDIALSAVTRGGIVAAFTLEPGSNGPATPLMRLRRTVVMWNHDLGDFARALRLTPERGEPPPVQRAMPVDLAQIAGASLDATAKNVDALVDRVAAIRPSTIHMRGVDDTTAELAGRVAASIWRRLGVQVHAVMPVALPRATFERVARLSPELQGVVIEGADPRDSAARDAAIERVAAMRAEHPALVASLVLKAQDARAATLPPSFDAVVVNIDSVADTRALRGLAKEIAARVPLDKVVFVLPARDFGALARAADALQLAGARHFAYDRDDATAGCPRVADIRRRFSVQSDLGVR